MILQPQVDPDLALKMKQYIDGRVITSENIGQIRASLKLPFDCAWNALVLDLTAAREIGSPSPVNQCGTAQPEPTPSPKELRKAIGTKLLEAIQRSLSNPGSAMIAEAIGSYGAFINAASQAEYLENPPPNYTATGLTATTATQVETEEQLNKLKGETEAVDPEKMIRAHIADVLNSYSRENRSDTPDFILADLMADCLAAFESASNHRRDWLNKTEPEEAPMGTPQKEPTVEERVGKLASDVAAFVSQHRNSLDGPTYRSLSTALQHIDQAYERINS